MLNKESQAVHFKDFSFFIQLKVQQHIKNSFEHLEHVFMPLTLLNYPNYFEMEMLSTIWTGHSQ